MTYKYVPYMQSLFQQLKWWLHPKPTIHLYTICWNEQAMLPFFFKYYDQWVDRYIIYDDGSTDNTLTMLGNHPKVEVRPFPRLEVDSYILAAKQLHNHSWKESRGKADWVILTAIDEFIYHPNLISYLHQSSDAGISAIPALGYQMLSDYFPTKGASLIHSIQSGAPWKQMNKLSLFQPSLIEETNYAVGRHSSSPIGATYPKRDELLNLHYKYLSFDFTFQRHKELHEKLGQFDKDQNWGHKYKWAAQKLREDWNYYEAKLVHNVPTKALTAHEQHSLLEDRWWHSTTKTSSTLKNIDC